jgi:capsule polysaccharide export protein KpsE/RkpR
MIDFLESNFIMDRSRTRIYFKGTYQENNGVENIYDIITPVDRFIEMFAEPIQKAMDSGTDIMDEIKAFDPENKLGYNDVII